MKKRTCGLFGAAAGLLVLAGACSSSGSGGRTVNITQSDAGCTPAQVDVTPGEKLNLVVKNDSSKDPFEVEGIDGTSLEELAVPKGLTRSIGYTVPDGPGVHKVKCYVPGGTSTIIQLTAGGASQTQPTAPSNTHPTRAAGDATPGSSTPVGGASASTSATTVAITLNEYTVTTDKPSVKAGQITFIATNVSPTQIHELAVLKIKPDGSFDNLGEVEDIDPQQGGSVKLDLGPGAYQLACLITIGEAGSTVDHYQQGMHTDFTVTQ